MMSIFSYDQQKALRELFIVLEKGIDLLANENLDKDLYDAFEKYADSTIKMVEESYGKNYISYFSNPYMSHNYYIHTNSIDYTHISIPHSAMSICCTNRQLSEYREKLKNLLQKVTTVVKELVEK